MPGVYISYPFCAQKCTYCNFTSNVLPADLAPRYVDALIREIDSVAFAWNPETVYLGGGTPSSMAGGELARILKAVPGYPWSEATIEAAPGSFSPEAVREWVDSGINRVSLGVQSFVPRELARTGRRHSAETVVADLQALKNYGLSNVNLDLIAGLPGQTAESWEESLNWIERLMPQHVSVYMLEVDEDSRLGREMMLGGVRYGAADVPDDARIADFYERAIERLRAMGIERYEISNFARPGAESRHNLKYWKLEPYLGFGADAHSLDAGMRFQNVESAREYIRLSPAARTESTVADPASERFFVGLRQSDGIEVFPEDWLAHREKLERLVAGGWMQREGKRIRLTDVGVMVSNEILQEFLT